MAFNAGAIIASTKVNMKGFTKGLSSMKSSAGIAGKVIAAAFGAALMVATKKANDYAKSMKNVSTLVDTSAVNINKLSQEVLKLDPALGNAIQITDALYQSFSSGADTVDEAMKTTVDSAKFAKAGLTDVSTAVDVLTTAVNAYGKSAMNTTQAADIFFTAIREGKLTGESLSGAIGTSIPLFAATGIKLEELAAGMAAMTKQGVDAANSTTQLNAIVNAFLKPSTKMKATLEELGYSSGSAFLEAEGLAGALKMLEKNTNGDASALSELLPNIRALRGAMALTGVGGEEFTDILGEMSTAAGATQEAFDKQEKTWDTFKNQLTNLGIVVGQTGKVIVDKLFITLGKTITKIQNFLTSAKGMELMENIANAVTNAIDGLFKALEPIGKIIAGLVKRLAEMDAGQIKFMLSAGLVIALLPKIVSGIKMVSAAFSFLAANPVVAVVAGVAAVTAGLVALARASHKRMIADLSDRFGDLAEEAGLAGKEAENFVDQAGRIEDAFSRTSAMGVTSYDVIASSVSQLSQELGIAESVVAEIGSRSETLSEEFKNQLLLIKEQAIEGESYGRALQLYNQYAEEATVLQEKQKALAQERKKAEEAIAEALKKQLEWRLTDEEQAEERKKSLAEYEEQYFIYENKKKLGLLNDKQALEEQKRIIEEYQSALLEAQYTGKDGFIGDKALVKTKEDLEEIEKALDKMNSKIGGDTLQQRLNDQLTMFKTERDEELAHLAFILGEQDRLEQEAAAKQEALLKERQQAFEMYFSAILKVAQTGADLIFGTVNNNIQREINAEQEASNVKLSEIEDRYNKGLITEKQYSEQKQVLEDNANTKMNELLEKQFENQKDQKRAGAVIDAASSIMGWWSQAPSMGPIAGPIFGTVMSGLTAGALIKQLAEIDNQTFTPMRKGGPASGLIRMNEDGGEMAWLPDGSFVLPHDMSNALANKGNNIYVSFDGANINNEIDLEYVTEVVANKIGRELRLSR